MEPEAGALLGNQPQDLLLQHLVLLFLLPESLTSRILRILVIAPSGSPRYPPTQAGHPHVRSSPCAEAAPPISAR